MHFIWFEAILVLKGMLLIYKWIFFVVEAQVKLHPHDVILCTAGKCSYCGENFGKFMKYPGLLIVTHF